MVVALEPVDPAVLVAPHPDRRHVDVESREDLRVHPALDLAERVGHALLERAVVDRRAAAGLREVVVDALGQFRQLGAQRRAARRYRDRRGRHRWAPASSSRRGLIQILDQIRGNFLRFYLFYICLYN